jgi:hypothetical protein
VSFPTNRQHICSSLRCCRNGPSQRRASRGVPESLQVFSIALPKCKTMASPRRKVRGEDDCISAGEEGSTVIRTKPFCRG